jgi:hypothetical protein
VITFCIEDAPRCTEWEFVQLLRERPAHDQCAGAAVSLFLPPMVYTAISAVVSAECARRAAQCATQHPERVIYSRLCARHWLVLAAHLSTAGDTVPANWLRLAACRHLTWDYRELDNLLRSAAAV